MNKLSEPTAFWVISQVASAAVPGREGTTLIPYDRSSLLFTVLFSSLSVFSVRLGEVSLQQLWD